MSEFEPNKCENFYLALCSKPLRFEGVSKAKLTNVFFDNTNYQVFTVHSGNMTDVLVKHPFQQDQTMKFNIEEKGPVISIKFSPDQKILAVQRTRTCVAFINFINCIPSVEYSQSCKSKSSKLLGFNWTTSKEILFVTDEGFELYQIEGTKCSIKLLKSLSFSVNWFVYCSVSTLLLISVGPIGNLIQPFLLKNGQVTRLPKFEIDLMSGNKVSKLCLLERDVSLGFLYNQLRIFVMCHHQPTGSHVLVYTLIKTSVVKKTHVLRLDRSGRFAISTLDNLVIVHHQTSKTSVIYDIEMEAESDGTVSYHLPVTQALSIKPITKSGSELDLYSVNWVMFQPNFVIDAKIGFIWWLELNLESFTRLTQNKCWLVKFLTLRSNAKNVVTWLLYETLVSDSVDMEELGALFDEVNKVYRSYLEIAMQSQIGLPVSSLQPLSLGSNMLQQPLKVVIDQSHMYTHILLKFADYVNENPKTTGGKLLIWVLIEYIRSLTDLHIPAQHYLHELIINTLVLHKSYYQLHQLLQYHMVSDSKPLACLLLSLENLYPAAHQLAIDMLQRLSNASDEITEVLLSKQRILPALRYATSMGIDDQISVRKILEVARSQYNEKEFFSILKYFELTKQLSNGNTILH